LMGANLRAGARIVSLSHTFVLAQMKQQWFLNMCAANNLNNQDPTLVFRGPLVLGIVTDNLLLSIGDMTHEDAYGEPMIWFLHAMAPENSQP